ncbi:hypothetical protein HK105_205043 [Polyrhizophydium stewartii]|uniref:Uncharacterized protein n=1 Tax=Polyrhizophydium stewartii TaxID=2732419 RepID=A0ABR4N7A3_9FUNG|nr:Endoplasmic reticulum-Golgi intermediate compartment protein 2 [Polyrhizophydium stewartii]
MSVVDKKLSKRLAALDAFPKIELQLQQTTQSGGIVSLVMLFVLLVLASSEVYRWRSIDQKYEFLVDQTRSHEHALQINVDVTIAMDCKYLRADVLDISDTSLAVKEALHASPVVFHTEGTLSLASLMRRNWDMPLDINKLIRDKARERKKMKPPKGKLSARPTAENGGHGADKTIAGGVPNACRFRGSFPANKVEGMLHFTAGGHGYYGSHTPHDAINFTHRIDELSFGARYPGLVNPLDYTLEEGKTHFDNFMYYIGVVPTIYVDNARSLFSNVMLANQYAVTEFSHAIDPENPDTLPGIFIKYNIEPIMVRVTESRLGLVQFTTRMCGIIGGAYVTIGAILSGFHAVNSALKKQH